MHASLRLPVKTAPCHNGLKKKRTVHTYAARCCATMVISSVVLAQQRMCEQSLKVKAPPSPGLLALLMKSIAILFAFCKVSIRFDQRSEKSYHAIVSHLKKSQDAKIHTRISYYNFVIKKHHNFQMLCSLLTSLA